MTYVKIIDETTIETAPRNKGSVSNYNNDIAAMTADGYYPYKEEPQPSGMVKPELRFRLDDGIVIGYWVETYIPKTLDEYKADKKEQINDWRNLARLQEGAEYNNDTFDVDEPSQSNILAQIKVAELINNPSATYTYRSKTNTNHEFNVTQLQALGLAIAQKVNEIYSHSWELKAKVDEANSYEEVDAINW